MGLPVIQPSRVTVMIKPVGALCNLDCTYCYYLPTKTIYGGHERRMSLRTLESVFASVLPRFGEEVTIAWQGGEPTLAGLDFFRKAIEFQNRYRRPGQQVRHALQTNGTLLDDEWCRFLHDNDFLIGLSVDGPPRFHDHYRLTNRAESSSDLVLRGMRLLQEHVVQYNILCVLNDVNVHHPDEVMGYLLNLGSRWLQFIPAVEWEPDPARPGHNNLAPYSPPPEAYGKFLCRTFDLWFSKYRLRISIREIDAVLSKLVMGMTPYCILDSSCHNQLTVEHDGSVFGCDHFVERRWQLGQIGQPDWVNSIGIDGTEEVGLTIHGTGYRKASALGGRDIHAINDVPVDVSDGQPNLAATGDPDGSWYDRLEVGRLGAFAARKQHLPEKCQSCQWRPYCHGGCPKHRPHGGDVAERTILCEAYMAFYAHAMPKMMWLADFLRKGQQPPDPTDNPDPSLAAIAATNGPDDQPKVIQRKHLRPQRPAGASIGRNDPCPCGSGLKYKRCHGRNL